MIKVNEDYWNEFYSKSRLSSPSTFFEFVSQQSIAPNYIFDIGCGNARDTKAFRDNNYKVVGIDRSESAINNNNKGKLDGENYINVDISNTQELQDAFNTLSGSILVYSRFFLHSIDEETERKLLTFLNESLKKGDKLALEFRTTEDELINKVFDNHYRRYVDSDKLVQVLNNEYSFDIDYYYKGRGLSIFKDEDPFLARILATKK